MMSAMTRVSYGGKEGSCQKSYSREQFCRAHWLKKQLAKVNVLLASSPTKLTGFPPFVISV